MMLIVDDRENDLLIHKLYASMGNHDDGGHVKVKRLQSADYIIGEIGIEAKEINDLYHSIMGHGRSRTIVGQLMDLQENFERPMLVVYGTQLKPYIPGGRPNRQQIAREIKKMNAVIKKFKQNLIIQFPNIQYMELPSMDDMVDWLSSVHHNLRIRRMPVAEPREKTKSSNRKIDLRVRVLSAIDGISERAAHDLLTEFGSIPRLLRSRTSQRKLMEIDGIGRKRAKAILSLRERYPDQPESKD
jgi:ERCC4-type nuclease